MKQAWFVPTLVAAALAGCVSVRGELSLVTDEASLLTANAEYDRAIITADGAALDRIYAPDFTFVGDKAELRNKDEQIKYMTDGSLRLLYARSDDISVRHLGPDDALLTGRFTGRYRTATKEVSFVERYSSVWTRQRSGWRLRHEHSSLVPEPGR